MDAAGDPALFGAPLLWRSDKWAGHHHPSLFQAPVHYKRRLLKATVKPACICVRLLLLLPCVC
ncbi:hypothetical protein ACP70R_002801 [Stipagrostis hirtigluma subsp. patula]